MNKSPGSLGSSVMSFALMVLLAAWAINSAAHLILAVLPVLIGVAVTAVLAFIGVNVWRNRDYW